MIFVSLGSQKFQFNRLLIKIDELIKTGVIKDEVFAQIGYSDYEPINYSWEKFLNRDVFLQKIRNSASVITHAGTGAIIGAVNEGKKVIAVPRLAKYGEHVDDHQIQIVELFEKMNIITACYETEELARCILEIEQRTFKPYKSNTETMINDINSFLGTIK